MAITKIHPIKTTLNLSIDYICDPDKTDEEILISTHACGYKTAALEFIKTKEASNSSCKNLARHLIQSFMPGEVTPEVALQIGIELCQKHLQDKYQYVITTHVDKGHIHNHIIFNNVSFTDGNAYISNKRSYHQIRNISDSLCKNNGLSIASEIASGQVKTRLNGASYKEYQERKRGNSYKAKLQYTIDAAIRSATDWDDFLSILRNDGYEIKHGKHISFRAIGQQRFTRSKTIGEDYSEERIKERIVSIFRTHQYKKSLHSYSKGTVIDISASDLASESAGFSNWLKLQNLKNMSKSWNEITLNTSSDINSFYKYIDDAHDDLGKTQSEIKSIESEIRMITEKINSFNTYNKYKNTYTNYQKSNTKDAYFRMHEREIILFDAAREVLKTQNPLSMPVNINELEVRLEQLKTEIQQLRRILSSQKEKISKVNQLRSDLETFLKYEHDKNKQARL